MGSVLGLVGKGKDLLEKVTTSFWFLTPSTFGLSVKILTFVYIIAFATIDWVLLRVSYYHQAYRSFSGPLAQFTFLVEFSILLVCFVAVVGVYGKKQRALAIFEWSIFGCVCLVPVAYVTYCVKIASGTADGTEGLAVVDILFLCGVLLFLVGLFVYTALHAIRVVDKLRLEMGSGSSSDGATLMVNEPEFV